MSDRAALLRTILAAPADDAPRLVFADWLDEQGDSARAELIRLQCLIADLEKRDGRPAGGMELVGFSHQICRESKAMASFLEDETFHAKNCERCAWARVNEILTPEQSLEWFEQGVFEPEIWGGFGRPTGSEWHGGWFRDSSVYIDAKFVRGFVGEIQLSAADWLQHGDAITAEHPVRTVRLTTMPDYNVLATYALIQSGTQHVLVYGASDMPLQRGVGPTQREAVVNALAKQWPRVKFELPPKSEDRRIALLAQHEEST